MSVLNSTTWVRLFTMAALVLFSVGASPQAILAQQNAEELSAEQVKDRVVGRTFDVVFDRDTGEKIQAVITFSQDGRFFGDNKFVPALQDGTVTNSFDGKFRMRGSQLCRQSKVVILNDKPYRGKMSDERCWRIFSQNERLVFYSVGTGVQSTWKPRR